MTKPEKLTPAEWEIMDVIWKLGGLQSVRQVIEHAYPDGEKAYTTVQTIMNILVKKGVLVSEKIGLVNYYRPVKVRGQVVDAELSNMARRIFQGSIPAMTNYLINMKDLSRDEIQAIKSVLAEKEDTKKEKDND